MSQFWCPSCNQFYPETGYCPFDGTRLNTAPEAVSAQHPAMRAVSAHDDGGAAAIASYHHNAAAEYDKLVGQTLDGRYLIERKIGEGGMGVVFAARHAVIERPLAIKVLKKEVARDTATIKRFVQEAKAASRIGHPNIVDVTDFGTTPDGLTYSVMEYVDGLTLSQAIKTGAPFTLGRALPIAAQIARALGAAHAKGIVHRDLKPENIFLLNRDGRRDFVKIVDFGIAKVTPLEGQSADGPRLTRAGAVFGTPEYMAPEQAAGRNDTDGRVDIYALGIILYEMVTGRVPHKADSMVRTLAMQMLDPILPPSQLRPDLTFSPEFEAVLLKALAKKREQRYATMDELLLALDGAGGGIPLTLPMSASVESNVFQLSALPPGADPAAVGALPPTVRTHPKSSPPPRAAPSKSSPPPRARRGSTPVSSSSPTAPTAQLGTAPQLGEAPRVTSKKIRNEPAFVTRERPATYDHVFEDEAPAPARRARWPFVLLAIVLFGGGGVAIALLAQGHAVVTDGSGEVPLARVDGGVASDAPTTIVLDVPGDAGVVDAAAADGGGVDAGQVALGRRDGGTGVSVGRHPDARGPVIDPTKVFSIQIITKPDSGVLYVNDSYRGPSGTNLEQPLGTRAKIKCTLPGYQPGFVEVVFDGKTEVAMCHMERIKRCIDGVKNPFDDCPE